MDHPLISIIMPVYNGAAYLEEAIDSLLRQTYPHFELLIFNDGSTDDSVAIIERYTDPRIHLYHNEKNLGIIKTKNRGIEIARGKYIATLDADDIALPTRLEKQVALMESDPSIGLSGTLHIEIDGNGKRGKKSPFPVGEKEVKTYLLLANCFCHSATMLRASLMKELKYQEAFPMAEDFDLWQRVALSAKVVNHPEYLTLYRVHGNNISITKRDLMFDTVQKLNARMLQQLQLEFSNEELSLHSNLLSYSCESLGTGQGFGELKKWIIKFYSKIKSLDEYDAGIVRRILAERWIVACFNRRRFADLLVNPFVRWNAISYYRTLLTKIFGREESFN